MWKTILSFLGSGLLKVVQPVAQGLVYALNYLLITKKEQIQEKKEAKRKSENEKIDDVCDNGSIEDLIDLGVK